jgi:hypothetical protein
MVLPCGGCFAAIVLELLTEEAHGTKLGKTLLLLLGD